MAIVKKVHPGVDGLVRTVELQTIKGTYSRPIHKLVLLLPNTDQDVSSDANNLPETSSAIEEDIQAIHT